MNRIILSLLISYFLCSCSENTNPLDSIENDPEKGNQSIIVKFTGKFQEVSYEFLIINDSDNPVWYAGYEEYFPIYITEIQLDTGFVSGGEGWCGVGLIKIEFVPADSFLIYIQKPDTDKPWRAGIPIYYNLEEESQFVWSKTI